MKPKKNSRASEANDLILKNTFLDHVEQVAQHPDIADVSHYRALVNKILKGQLLTPKEIAHLRHIAAHPTFTRYHPHLVHSLGFVANLHEDAHRRRSKGSSSPSSAHSTKKSSAQLSREISQVLGRKHY